MSLSTLENYALDNWKAGEGQTADISSAVTSEKISVTGSGGLDFKAMLEHGRNVGGPALRAMTFHERAAMLKKLGLAIMERKDELYALSLNTGATAKDGWIDIEGGAGTLFSICLLYTSPSPRDRG